MSVFYWVPVTPSPEVDTHTNPSRLLLWTLLQASLPWPSLSPFSRPPLLPRPAEPHCCSLPHTGEPRRQSEHSVTECVRMSSEHYGTEEDRHLCSWSPLLLCLGIPLKSRMLYQLAYARGSKTSYCPHSLGRGSLLTVKTALPEAPQHLPAASALVLGSLLLTGLP